ncbi:alpha/beta fold hydrolase [Williamsia sp. CHRR-6]|uniref:alpha/beta fold hydrolase n=1 Tax=Williamsia sp. CHRR-6 TaxID=2835871 RepID=UPI001BDB09A6|nr:alpha/beta fold hydrolase [Williamsia sp. CHRR-6]MBT0568175.1 alpha/beta fold hydrolase [Williamsia sp. CHRR-6]
MTATPITEFRHESFIFDVTDSGPLDSPGSNGIPVVLLHGFPQNRQSWRRVTAILNDSGIRTLAPDQRGYSPRARPRGRWNYTTPTLAADVAALIDTLGGPVHLVGHDWGASIGWAAAASYPERISSYTAVSVPHPGAFIWAVRHSDQARRSWYMLAFQVPFIPELLMPRGTTFEKTMHASGLDAESTAIVRAAVMDTPALGKALNYYRALPLSGKPIGRVCVPTTHIWGEHDTYLSRAGAEATARFVAGDYRFVAIPDGNHWLPENSATEVAAEIVNRVRNEQR